MQVSGMTKRDYFATKILQGLMERYDEPGYDDKSAICEAYRLADLMVGLSTMPICSLYAKNDEKGQEE